MSQREYILLLGSNLGDRKKNIETALKKMQEEGFIILRKSEFLTTKPIGFVSSNIFCNFAASISSDNSPCRILEIIKQIESDMGRIGDSSDTGKYTDRIIDIDIVQSDNLIFECRRLEIPHKKHVFERDFSKELILSLVNNQKQNI